MNFVKELIAYLMANGIALAAILSAALALAEMIVRLTPTKEDDTFVERVGTWMRRLFDLLKIPNTKSGGGSHPTAHEKYDGKQ